MTEERERRVGKNNDDAATDRRLVEIDRQIAQAVARVNRLGLLIERQQILGTSTRETQGLVAEVEGFLASLRAHRRMLASALQSPAV